ncbi:emerin [Pelodytes ibericus]
MEEYKRMSDDELIQTLRKHNIQHGPIVGTTRTLYEKKLYEYERKKSKFQPSFGSYDSKPQFSSRNYKDDNVDEEIYEEKTITQNAGKQAYSRSKLETFSSRDIYKDNVYQPVSQTRYTFGTTQGVEARKPIREKKIVEAPRSRYIPLWLQILLLLILTGFLAYMYFCEREENPFKHIGN